MKSLTILTQRLNSHYILGSALDDLYKSIMTAISRKVIQDSWINIFTYGFQATDGSSKKPFSFSKGSQKFFRALNGGLYSLKNFFEEKMAEIFAWTCVILTGMILLFYTIGLAKAAFFKSANRRKEILKVAVALPMLIWCVIEFFLVLFRILPDSHEGNSSNTSNFLRRVRKNSRQSLAKRWGDLEDTEDQDEYEGK